MILTKCKRIWRVYDDTMSLTMYTGIFKEDHQLRPNQLHHSQVVPYRIQARFKECRYPIKPHRRLHIQHMSHQCHRVLIRMQLCLIQQVSIVNVNSVSLSSIFIHQTIAFLFLDAYNYQNFPQGPQTQNYGTYPGAYAQQQPGQPGYPHQAPPGGYPHAPNWPPQ